MAVTGAQTCGKRSCPVCGPRIAADHRSAVARAVGTAQAAGWSVRFLTLTFRHRGHAPLSERLDLLTTAWRALNQGGAWTRLCRRHGIRGTIRVIECVHGDVNGWHPHLHVLLFVEPTPGAPSMLDLFVAVVDRWRTILAAMGESAGVIAQDMREVGAGDLDRIAGYVTKETAQSIAWEVTGERTKTRKALVPPSVLLAHALAGHRRSGALFSEYETATLGRRMWEGIRTPLRVALADLPVLSPDLVPDLESPAEREALIRLRGDDYADWAGRGSLRADTAALVAEGADALALLWWLSDRGIAGEAVAPDAPGDADAVPVAPIAAPPGAPSWLALP